MKRKNNSRSSQQFEDENAQRPIIDSPVVTFVEDDFGSHVFGSAAKCPRLAGHAQQFGETEIDLTEKNSRVSDENGANIKANDVKDGPV